MSTRIHHPYRSALNTLAGSIIFALLAMVATWGLSTVGALDSVVIWISFIFLVFFSLMFIIIWAVGLRQMRAAKAFLESERVLLSWTYSAAEWQQLKETRWQEEKNDWKVQLGCLTVLLALAGLLTGVMLGLEDGLVEAVRGGLAGVMLGGLIGGVFGVLVAGSNYWSARRDFSRPKPGLVALGVNEIYASDDYFRGDGVTGYIREAKIQVGRPAVLDLQIVVPPRPRMPTEELWVIPLPPGWVDRVEEILPALNSIQSGGDNNHWEE